MPYILLKALLPIAFNAIMAYLKNRDSSNDEAVMYIMKKSCEYFASKDNNTVNYGHVSTLGSTQIFKEEV